MFLDRQNGPPARHLFFEWKPLAAHPAKRRILSSLPAMALWDFVIVLPQGPFRGLEVGLLAQRLFI